MIHQQQGIPAVLDLQGFGDGDQFIEAVGGVATAELGAVAAGMGLAEQGQFLKSGF